MNTSSLVADKARLRLAMKRERRRLSPAFVRAASVAICRLVQKQLFFHRSRRIGLYMAVNNEVNLALLAHTAKERKKECYYPALNPLGAKETMAFLSARTGNWQLNRYAIAEPLTPLAKRVALRTLDLVLLPLVAFDDRGGRLGMGGGYYDRTFRHLAGQMSRGGEKTILVGIGYEFQRVRRMPTNEMDVRLDYVVTERSLVDCRS